MGNHPNRGRGHNPCRTPTPEDVKRARQWAGLTQEAAAAKVCAALNSWQCWEAPVDTPTHRRMHPAFWRLFQKEVGLDPDRPLGPQLT